MKKGDKVRFNKAGKKKFKNLSFGTDLEGTVKGITLEDDSIIVQFGNREKWSVIKPEYLEKV